jgi:3',5'-cyclic AMP phosphodiesterase CpdA
VRVVCISDTHSMAEQMACPLPPGDILIHAGDFTNHGRREEVERFNTWLATLPHRLAETKVYND